MADEDYYTVTELAEQADVSTAWIRMLIGDNRIEATKRGKMWFIHKREAERWLAEREERVESS